MSLIKKINDPSGKVYDDISVGALTFDTEPIPGSFNPVTSDAVAKAIDIEFGKVGGSIAPRYDSTQTYSVGDYVMYNRRLYVCNTAINTAEEWDHTKWTQTDVANIIGDVETLLAAL